MSHKTFELNLRAKTKLTCAGCGATIPVGVKYTLRRSKPYGWWISDNLCEDCIFDEIWGEEEVRMEDMGMLGDKLECHLCLHCAETKSCYRFELDFGQAGRRVLYLCAPCLDGLRGLPAPFGNPTFYASVHFDFLEPARG